MVAGYEQAKIPLESPVSPRARWKYADKATEFHRSHGYGRYAVDFVAALEAEMHDSELSREIVRNINTLWTIPNTGSRSF